MKTGMIPAGAGKDEAAEDDVFLKSAEGIHVAVDGRFREDSRALQAAHFAWFTARGTQRLRLLIRPVTDGPTGMRAIIHTPRTAPRSTTAEATKSIPRPW